MDNNNKLINNKISIVDGIGKRLQYLIVILRRIQNNENTKYKFFFWLFKN